MEMFGLVFLIVLSGFVLWATASTAVALVLPLVTRTPPGDGMPEWKVGLLVCLGWPVTLPWLLSSLADRSPWLAWGMAVMALGGACLIGLHIGAF